MNVDQLSKAVEAAYAPVEIIGGPHDMLGDVAFWGGGVGVGQRKVDALMQILDGFRPPDRHA